IRNGEQRLYLHPRICESSEMKRDPVGSRAGRTEHQPGDESQGQHRRNEREQPSSGGNFIRILSVGAHARMPQLTPVLSDAPPVVANLEPRRNRRVHWSSLVRPWVYLLAPLRSAAIHP